jgi:hypothetical protein
MSLSLTSYDDLPAGLATELEDAGLDARSTYDLVVATLHEDVPSWCSARSSAPT